MTGKATQKYQRALPARLPDRKDMLAKLNSITEYSRELAFRGKLFLTTMASLITNRLFGAEIILNE
jgi:hypothetical protein